MNRRSKGSGPQPYDFRRPSKLSREHARALQIAFETFARQYATVLTSTLRVVSSVQLVGIEQRSYDEYIASLANPTIALKLNLDPLPGTVLFEHSLGIAMAAVDHMLGGPGGEQPQRQLTEIELVLIRGMHDRAMGELRYALAPIVAIQPRIGAIEYNPQFAQACSASDPVVVASFEMKVGNEGCVATICIPYASIMPELKQDEDDDVALSAADRSARETTYRSMAAGLESTPIDVAVKFQPVRMRPEDIVGLRPGDVVPLDHLVTMPLTVTAADITFAHAVPGNQGARLACLVVPAPKENTRA